MDTMSLHPLDDMVVARFMRSALGDGEPAPAWSGWWPRDMGVLFERMRAGDEVAANQVTLSLAHALGSRHPTFTAPGTALTTWEARVDRGIGMFLRPPSRLFRESGVELEVVRSMPIRLDAAMGMMGGAFVPAHLVPRVAELLESREQRVARRLREAEYDPVVTLLLFREALAYAQERGLGLFEAMDAVGPGGEAIHGGEVIVGSRDRVPKAERRRIDELSKPPKRPGLLDRMRGRGNAEATNGHHPPSDPIG